MQSASDHYGAMYLQYRVLQGPVCVCVCVLIFTLLNRTVLLFSLDLKENVFPELKPKRVYIEIIFSVSRQIPRYARPAVSKQ